MKDKSGSEQIDDIVTLYGGWKGRHITQLRKIIKDAAPEVVEEVKWRMRSRPEGLPVWSYDGIVCLLETFKNDQKLVFTKGAQIKDAHKLFNARLKSKTDRAIELHEDSILNEGALKALVREALELNILKAKEK